MRPLPWFRALQWSALTVSTDVLLLIAYLPTAYGVFRKDTPSGCTPPAAAWMHPVPKDRQTAVSTHPTGMHSCNDQLSNMVPRQVPTQ